MTACILDLSNCLKVCQPVSYIVSLLNKNKIPSTSPFIVEPFNHLSSAKAAATTITGIRMPKKMEKYAIEHLELSTLVTHLLIIILSNLCLNKKRDIYFI